MISLSNSAGEGNEGSEEKYMKNYKNINQDDVRSLVRDGLLPADILEIVSAEDGLRLEQLEDATYNRIWPDRGALFVAVAIDLVNLGDSDRVIEACSCEFSWASHVELVEKSENTYREIFVAGDEEFAKEQVLNTSIIGARLGRKRRELDGTLIFRVYGAPCREELAATIPATVTVSFSNGLEISNPASVRVQDVAQVRRMLRASQIAPAVAVGLQPARPRRPLFDVDPEIGSRETVCLDRECAA